jgi:hypothetical protein
VPDGAVEIVIRPDRRHILHWDPARRSATQTNRFPNAAVCVTSSVAHAPAHASPDQPVSSSVPHPHASPRTGARDPVPLAQPSKSIAAPESDGKTRSFSPSRLTTNPPTLASFHSKSREEPTLQIWLWRRVSASVSSASLSRAGWVKRFKAAWRQPQPRWARQNKVYLLRNLGIRGPKAIPCRRSRCRGLRKSRP